MNTYRYILWGTVLYIIICYTISILTAVFTCFPIERNWYVISNLFILIVYYLQSTTVNRL